VASSAHDVAVHYRSVKLVGLIAHIPGLVTRMRSINDFIKNGARNVERKEANPPGGLIRMRPI
jgi:hypothetical protein